MIQSLLCRPLANGSIRLLSALLLLLSPLQPLAVVPHLRPQSKRKPNST